MSPRATIRALSLSSFPQAVCFALRTSLTGIISSSLQGFTPMMKVFDFHFDCMKPSRANVIIKFEDSFE